MNKKETRSLPVKPLKKQSVKRRNEWWPIIILAALLIGYLVWRNNSFDANTAPGESTPPVTEQNSATQSEAKPINSHDNTSDNNDLTLDSENSISTDNHIPDPRAILNATLPETDSLAKEEIDRLEDERQRLAEQEKLAAEQLAMNKQLTEMKAEQIALLEEQIAQLEATESTKTSAK